MNQLDTAFLGTTASFSAPSDTPLYISTRAAAEYLGLYKGTLEQYRLRGTGPVYFKLGRAVKYRIGDLEAWAMAGRRTSTSDTGASA